LNLSAVDPEDPTAEREGPVSLKIQYPFGVGHGLTLYSILNINAGPLDVALAPRLDLFQGDVLDLGLSIYYQRTLAPRAISTFGFSVGEVDFFGEAVVSWGSDRSFVRPSADQSAAEESEGPDLVLDTYLREDEAFFSGTAGFRWIREFPD